MTRYVMPATNFGHDVALTFCRSLTCGFAVRDHPVGGGRLADGALVHAHRGEPQRRAIG